MKKLDLNFAFLGIDETTIVQQGKELIAGEVLAGVLISEVKGDAIKYFDWAVSLNKKKVIEIDDSDFIKLKSLVSETEKLTILLKAQLLKYFETLK